MIKDNKNYSLLQRGEGTHLASELLDERALQTQRPSSASDSGVSTSGDMACRPSACAERPTTEASGRSMSCAFEKADVCLADPDRVPAAGPDVDSQVLEAHTPDELVCTSRSRAISHAPTTSTKTRSRVNAITRC